MAYAYHEDRRAYFEHQQRVTREHVIPFVESSWPLPEAARVLEIGCGEAGVLQAFLDRGAECVGVDLNSKRLEAGKELLAEAITIGRLRLLLGNIHDLSLQEQLGSFDLIVLKDVIEHIDDQPLLLARLRSYLKPNGCIFFGFPPWLMPFGGHQQVCRSKLLSRAPYIHLLPTSLYHRLLLALGENQTRINALMRNKRTGINMERFERIVADTGYRILNQRLYLTNPIYQYRFGIPPRQQLPLLTRIPYVRDLTSSCAYYLITSE